MITLGSILVLTGLLGLFFCMLSDSNTKWLSRVCGFSAITGVSLLVAGVAEIAPKKPTALDVYQGKTTLEITYRDSIPVDSVVVWKEEFKK
jgi:hypothetical protein